jgi:quercetin dioxygenase-like cupin family protein
MSLLSKPITAGNLSGAVFDFEVAGDILPMHIHNESTAHITIVARGSMKMRGIDWERNYECGAILDCPAGQAHEFVALEDNPRLVNIIKKG